MRRREMDSWMSALEAMEGNVYANQLQRSLAHMSRFEESD